jgi:hypothetical protein
VSERPLIKRIVEAIRNLGGRAHLREIYKEIRRQGYDGGGEDLDKLIRARIYEHSSDSDKFSGIPNDDLFSCSQERAGIWQLREERASELKAWTNPKMSPASPGARMRLVDLIRQETRAAVTQIMLLRHFNEIDRLTELGGSVEEFTFLQPTGTKWDFLRDGKPKIDVVVVIVRDIVHAVYRVVGVEAEGTAESLVSEAHRQFDIEREVWQPRRQLRRFSWVQMESKAVNATITGWERAPIAPVLRNNAQLFWKIDVNLLDEPVTLPDQEAEQEGSNDDASYSPQKGDRRQVLERQIRERRGQQQFRDALRKRYGSRCVVTGCEVLAVLEAAHIRPYRGENDNHVENGLLLRADIHTLFDLNLLGVEPEGLVVKLHPALRNDAHYASLEGKRIDCASNSRPSIGALRSRYSQFTDKKRCQQPLKSFKDS